MAFSSLSWQSLSLAALSLLVWAVCCNSLPLNRRSTDVDPDTTNCTTCYNPPADSQLSDGIEAVTFFMKFGILEHEDDPTTSMIFYTSLISLCQVAVRLESQLSLLSTVTNAPPNDDSTGNSSSAESDIASNENETGSSAVDDGSSHKHLQMKALCAVVGQVITDACNYALLEFTAESEGHDVDCHNVTEVATFSLSQYDSMRTLGEFSPDPFAIAEAYSVMKLLKGLRPEAEASDRDVWVQTLIAPSLHPPICNNQTHLYC